MNKNIPNQNSTYNIVFLPCYQKNLGLANLALKRHSFSACIKRKWELSFRRSTHLQNCIIPLIARNFFALSAPDCDPHLCKSLISIHKRKKIVWSTKFWLQLSSLMEKLLLVIISRSKGQKMILQVGATNWSNLLAQIIRIIVELFSSLSIEK